MKLPLIEPLLIFYVHSCIQAIGQNRYVVVFSDYLTRWCEAFPVPRVEVNAIARWLAGEIIGRHGAPRVLLADGGNKFLSELVLKVCTCIFFQIQKVTSSSYHPQRLDF